MMDETMLDQAWDSGFILTTAALAVFTVFAFGWFLTRGRQR